MARSGELGDSELDKQLLRFACLHGVITNAQAQALLSVEQATAAGALARLAGAGLLRRRRFGAHAPAVFSITPAGLARVDPEIPQADPGASLQHDVGVGWLWLAAKEGRLGSPGEVLTRAELEAADAPAIAGQAPRGLRTTPGRGGRSGLLAGFPAELPDERALHYPDLAVVDERGWTVVELLLAPWPLSIRGALLLSYAPEERVRRVVLAVREPGVARAILRSPFALALQGRLEVYPVRLTADLILTARA